jgi:hypothetical protein
MTEEKTYRLANCPCCGGEAALGKNYAPAGQGVTVVTVGVCCVDMECGLAMTIMEVKGADEDAIAEEVVSRWNKRIKTSLVIH